MYLLFFEYDTVVGTVVSVEDRGSHIMTGFKSASVAVDMSVGISEFIHRVEYLVKLLFGRTNGGTSIFVFSEEILQIKCFENCLVETLRCLGLFCPLSRVDHDVVSVEVVYILTCTDTRAASEFAVENIKYVGKVVTISI